ncbi:MAG: hypothetical protein ICV56_05015 [Nitrososphaeraceae archaeon]|nr:hypothetical protein [Nitrososphaeraceae archaeon]
MKFIKPKSKEAKIRDELHLSSLYKIVKIFQYTLGTILMSVALQIVLTSHYNTVMLIAVMATSYILAIILLTILTLRFFSWFKSNQNFVILLYGLASLMLAVNAIFTVINVNERLLDRPSEIWQFAGGTVVLAAKNTVLDLSYILSSILSFILTWAATVLLLNHYSQRLGRVRYWIIVSIPLIYFLSQFITSFLNLFAPLFESDPFFFAILFTLIFALSKTIGGIMFGIAFWTIAKNIAHTITISHYMIISAYGFVLLFISNQAIVLVTAPYPPFGLATISFMGLSSYLILVGIYASAISVAHDVKLRQSIRKFAIKESKLLDSIGSAEMEKEIQNRVMKIVNEQSFKMKEETGIQSSFDEEDIKEYLNKAIRETKREL